MLGGWSYGGVVAARAAALLEAEGLSVELLVLIDAPLNGAAARRSAACRVSSPHYHCHAHTHTHTETPPAPPAPPAALLDSMPTHCLMRASPHPPIRPARAATAPQRRSSRSTCSS